MSDSESDDDFGPKPSGLPVEDKAKRPKKKRKLVNEKVRKFCECFR
jgi:hypothetical protein